MKKFTIALTAIVILTALMFVEYRYIMCNQTPYYGTDGLMHIEIFGQVDTYYIETAQGH